MLKFEFLYSNDSGHGLGRIGVYGRHYLLICFPIELINTIFPPNMQPAMYFKLCSILVQLWLELSRFGQWTVHKCSHTHLVHSSWYFIRWEDPEVTTTSDWCSKWMSRVVVKIIMNIDQ